MKNASLYVTLSLAVTIFCCQSCESRIKPRIFPTSDNTTQANTNRSLGDFERQLTADGYFWQSGEDANTAEFLFRKDGTAVIIYGTYRITECGKWFYDQSKNQLQVAWAESPQTVVQFNSNEPDWSKITFSTPIYNRGTAELVRLKLLDDRFNINCSE
ncbi:hypothetical protein FAM09_13110 [Niastella caeni]|uniref:Uncharacterized protein n=1 Tax=Niastella caeni TaxID=2569763 RepID=A0A4S8HUW3_9BACT|nr:hypothetical protein [Niastella caeni]THU39438.1 hypothetical protein FAM09_13110 [Niastella caeni]